MRRATIILFALVLVAVAGQPAQAQEIGGFRLSDSATGEARSNFPSGTRVIYAILDYANLNNSRIGVEITDPRGVPLFNKSEVVSGSGTKVFEVSGSAILQNYQNLTNTQGPAARQVLDEALQADAKSVKIERGQSVVQFSSTLANISQSLSGLVTDSTSLNQANTSLNRVSALGRELADSMSVEQVQTSLQQMKSGLDEGTGLLSQAYASLGDGSNLYFADAPSGSDYTANSLLDGEITQTVQWTVGSGTAPAATATTEPGGVAPSPTATTQSVQLTGSQSTQATASPVVQSTGVQPTSQATATRQAGPTATLRVQPSLARTTATPVVSAGSAQAQATLPAVSSQPAATPGTVTSQKPAAAGAVTAAPTRGAPPSPTGAVAVAAKVSSSRSAGAAASTSGGLPLATLGALGGAIGLGLIALWFWRKK